MKVYIVTELFDGPYEDIIKVFQKEKDAKDYCDQHNNYLDIINKEMKAYLHEDNYRYYKEWSVD